MIRSVPVSPAWVAVSTSMVITVDVAPASFPTRKSCPSPFAIRRSGSCLLRTFVARQHATSSPTRGGCSDGPACVRGSPTRAVAGGTTSNRAGRAEHCQLMWPTHKGSDSKSSSNRAFRSWMSRVSCRTSATPTATSASRWWRVSPKRLPSNWPPSLRCPLAIRCEQARNGDDLFVVARIVAVIMFGRAHASISAPIALPNHLIASARGRLDWRRRDTQASRHESTPDESNGCDLRSPITARSHGTMCAHPPRSVMTKSIAPSGATTVIALSTRCRTFRTRFRSIQCALPQHYRHLRCRGAAAL